MKEKDIQILKYRTLQGQYLQANNKIVSLEKALDAANGESHELRELRKADLCHISYLESEISAKDKTIREKDEEIAKLSGNAPRHGSHVPTVIPEQVDAPDNVMPEKEVA